MKMTTDRKNLGMRAPRVSLNIRITKGRSDALRVLAQSQEKTLTQVVEEAIDAYVKPQLYR